MTDESHSFVHIALRELGTSVRQQGSELRAHAKTDEDELRRIRETQATHGRELGVQTAMLTLTFS